MNRAERARARRVQEDLRPGIFDPYGRHDPAAVADIAEWIASAPTIIGACLRVLMAPGPFSEQPDRIRDVGRVWHDIIRASPELSAWADEHFLEWLDRMPRPRSTT